MYNVIALGKIACNVAEKFAQYPQYKIFKVGSHLKKAKQSFVLEVCDTPEEYEATAPDMSAFFSDVQGREVLFIVSGANYESGLSLALLQQLNDSKVSILYIRPDKTTLDATEKLQEKVAFNVLQEYTRSAVFEKMYIVHNDILEEVATDITVRNYHDKINELMVSTLHMINVFSNSKTEFDTFSDPPEIARICSFGMASLDGDEKLYFKLDNSIHKVYYCAMNEEALDDKKLFGKIKNIFRKKNTDTVKVDYGVFSTNYDVNYVYCVSRSSTIQK